jgi:hypothetical protein
MATDDKKAAVMSEDEYISTYRGIDDSKEGRVLAQEAYENSWPYKINSFKDSIREARQKYLDGKIDANNAHARIEATFQDFVLDNELDIILLEDEYAEAEKIYHSVIDTLPKKTELKDEEKSLITHELEAWKKTDEGKKYANLLQEMTAAFYEHLKKNSK